MAQGIQDWSTTASSNGAADANINYAEGQTPASLNNSARAMMAALRAFYNAIGGGITYGGSGNTYTATNATPGTWSAYAEGQIIGFEPNATNTGAATLNVDGLGAKSIVKGASTAVASGDLLIGAFYLLRYDGTNFCIVGSAGAGSYQPLDATLTALAALSYTSGTLAITMTGADTFALATFGTAAGQNTGTSGANVPLMNGTNTWSGAQTIQMAGASFTLDASSGNATLIIEREAGSVGLLRFRTGSSTRWDVRAETTAESGANAGTPLNIIGYDDSGVSIGTALSFLRATLAATFGGAVTIPNGSAAAPSLNFAGATTTGMYYTAGEFVFYASSSTPRLYANGTRLHSTMLLYGPDGSVSAPGFTFYQNTNTGLYRIGANNAGFACNGAKVLDISSTGLAVTGTINGRVSTGTTTTGTLVAGDANDETHATGNITVPASVFVQYDKVKIYAGSASRTLTQGSGLTQRLHGTSTTGNLTLAARGMALIEFISATECVVSGDVS